MNFLCLLCSCQVSLRGAMITACTQMIWNSSTASWIPRPGEWVWSNGDTFLQTTLLLSFSVWPDCCVCWCRGRVVYQLTLSLWRLLCLCYCAEARLEVLKLTKHMEDGTIKARWRIRGLPFHSLLLRFYQKDKSHLYRYYTVHPDWSWCSFTAVIRLSLRRGVLILIQYFSQSLLY